MGSSSSKTGMRVEESTVEASSFKKVSRGKMIGSMQGAIANSLPPDFFEDPVAFVRNIDGEVIKESTRRWVAIFSLSSGRRVFFKRDRLAGWAESLKSLFLPSKGQKECSIASQLERRGLPVPEPLGWLEKKEWGTVKESYYLSEAIGAGISLIDAIRSNKELFVDSLAKSVRAFHDSGLFHQDLHGGNFLWDGESFFLTDLHRAKMMRSLSLNRKLWNFSQLFHSLRELWGEKDQTRFLEIYFAEKPIDVQERERLFQKIQSMIRRLQKRHWKSRTKRCLRESGEFGVKRERGILTYHRRDFPADLVKKVIEEHRTLVRRKSTLLAKASLYGNVSLFHHGGIRICVKQFCYPYLWKRLKENFRHSKGLKSWVSGNGLRVRGIPSPKPLALVEKSNRWGLGESFFIMDASEIGQEMDRCLLTIRFRDFKERRLFIRAFALWLSRLHQMNVYHKDMKTCNILVSKKGGTWEFHLLDLEDVRLNHTVDQRKLFKTLLQLNTSTPENIHRTDRLKFFKDYLECHPIVQDQKTFLKQLAEESKKRGLVYVSSEGVVSKAMEG